MCPFRNYLKIFISKKYLYLLFYNTDGIMLLILPTNTVFLKSFTRNDSSLQGLPGLQFPHLCTMGRDETATEGLFSKPLMIKGPKWANKCHYGHTF